MLLHTIADYAIREQTAKLGPEVITTMYADSVSLPCNGHDSTL